MKKHLMWLLLLTTPLLAGPAPQEQKGKTVTLDLLDLAKNNDFPMVKLKVNNVEGTFIIDTGMVVEGISITPEFAKKAKLKGSRTSFTLREGEEAIELKDMLFVRSKAGPEKDGVLSCTFFEKVRMTLDVPGKKVTFSTYDHPYEPPQDAAKTPFEFVKSMRGPFVKATVDGDKEAWLCVDTAANWSSVNEDAFAKLFSNVKKEKIFKTLYTVATTTLKMGDIEIKEAKFAKLTNQILKDTGANVVGLVGMNILRNYVVTFDYAKKEMVFSKSRS